MLTYQKSKELRDLGFPQKRHNYAKYFINENTIAYFEDIKNSFDREDYENRRHENPVNWGEHFVYIPELIDFIGIERYDATIYAAAWHWLDNREKPDELIKRFEDAYKKTTELVGEKN